MGIRINNTLTVLPDGNGHVVDRHDLYVEGGDIVAIDKAPEGFVRLRRRSRAWCFCLACVGSPDPAVVIEFKVFDPRREKTLEDTVARALAQVEERAYVAGLVARGIPEERIRTYGIAFRGKEVLVG